MRTELSVRSIRPTRLLSSIGEFLRASAKQKLVKYCPEGRHLFSPFGWDIGKKLCVNFPVGRPAPGAARPISFLIRSAQEIIFSRSAFPRGIIRATYCSAVRQGLSRRGRSRGGGELLWRKLEAGVGRHPSDYRSYFCLILSRHCFPDWEVGRAGISDSL